MSVHPYIESLVLGTFHFAWKKEEIEKNVFLAPIKAGILYKDRTLKHYFENSWGIRLPNFNI